MYESILLWLQALDGVEQSPRYHPEGDALFHSLQVFQHAERDDAPAHLLAAALLHDVGKAHARAEHAAVGADMLVGLPESTRWLVAHHLDLMRAPRRTRRRWSGRPALRDLILLRRWDERGRDPHARVCSTEQAVSTVLEALAEAPNSHGEYWL